MRIPLRLRQQQHMQHIRDPRVARRIRLLPLATHHPRQNLLQPCAIRRHSKHRDRNPHARRACNQSRHQRAPLPSPQKPHQQQNRKYLNRSRNRYQSSRRYLPPTQPAPAASHHQEQHKLIHLPVLQVALQRKTQRHHQHNSRGTQPRHPPQHPRDRHQQQEIEHNPHMLRRQRLQLCNRPHHQRRKPRMRR